MYNLMIKLSQRSRERRDIVEIAKRAADKESRDYRIQLSQAFERVFGYMPTLGEPYELGGLDVYLIQGFSFVFKDGQLQVLTIKSHPTPVKSAAHFHKLLETRSVIAEDDDRVSE